STNAEGDTLTGSDGKLMASQTRWTRQIWIPYHRSSDWVFRERTVPLISVSKDAAQRDRDDAKLTDGTWTRPSWSNKASKSYIKTYDPAWYATLPRDPQKLLARLKAEDPGEPGSSLHFYFDEVFSEVLRSGVAPADIRSALFQALAKTPGMKVVNDVATLDGRRGVAISFGAKGKQMVFDRATGQYIGERATSPDFPDVPGLGADKTTFLTSSRVDVVDSAPAAD
ncbi:MAG: putative polymerase sigma (70) factor, partial [Aeromicrobium sp.]|nr:putative polymerase sigma (70) factor [Aeromicrobium sp.]